jgi:hypothetical protein
VKKAILMLQESTLKCWLDFYPKNGYGGKEYTYREICDMVTKEGYAMSQFKRKDNSEYYIKIK